MSAIQKYWAKLARIERSFAIAPPIICKDGFQMSVQASGSHYCEPRELLADGAYTKWEVGFPSAEEETLMPYCSEPEEPLETVYGWVPTEVIDALIEKHGGLRDFKVEVTHPLHPAFRRLLDID